MASKIDAIKLKMMEQDVPSTTKVGNLFSHPLQSVAMSSKIDAIKLKMLDAGTEGTTTIVGDSSVHEDNSDMETEKTDATRTSKSRSSAARSSGTKERKRQALLAHAKKKAIENGEEWVERTGEEHRQDQRAAMIHQVSSDSGSIKIKSSSVTQAMTSEQLVGALIAKANRKKITIEERMWHLSSIDAYFAPKYAEKPRCPKSEDIVNDRFIVKQGSEGHMFCTLCNKWDSDTHRSSQMHKERCSEMALCDEMVGLCNSTRRWSSGLANPICKSSFRSHWGKDIDNMPRLLKDRLAKGCRITVTMPHWGKKGKKTIGLDDIMSLGFCAVTYPGSGKYRTINSAVPDRALEWSEIPEDEPLVELMDELPNDAIWWPATVINWHDQHIDHEYSSRDEYFTKVISGILCIFVLCWYQLMDDSWELQAWPIDMTRPRSLL